MTELEREINRQRSTKDPGRARKRKIKRESGNGISQLAKPGLNHRRSVRSVSSRSGPSIRERLVTTKVSLPEVSMPSIQGKLNSALESISHLATSSQSSHKPTSFSNVVTPRSAARKADPRRRDSHYEATTRTETQRIGNAKGDAMPRKNRRVFDAHAEADPPVMVRGGMGGMAFGRVASSRLNKHKSPKRRIDVPLNITGAELRLPSLPFVHLGWRAASLLMVLMMLTSLFLIWKAPVFQIHAIEAKGLQRLTVGDLNTVMGTIGKSIFTINPGLLDENLHQAFPELSKISVKVGLPASVKVVVTEREPVIAWIQDGSETWVDAKGISFPPRGTPANVLVRIEGHGTPPSISPAATQNTAQNVPESNPTAASLTTPTLKLSPEMVSAILALGAKMPVDTLLVYDSVHGLGWNDPKGWEVFFGAEDQDMQMKLAVYQALVERLQNEGIQPALISVEYVHAPYYRMER
jgi:cell division protein FtsQ